MPNSSRMLRAVATAAATATALALVSLPALARGGVHGSPHGAGWMAPKAHGTPAPSGRQAGSNTAPATTSARSSALAAAAAVTVLPAPQSIPADTMPSAALAAPMPELAPVAPLSPQLPTQFATGGSTTSTLALSPGTPSATPQSTSPSEAAPSHPGGGGKSLADCMAFWEPATHMSKAQWKASCVRTIAEEPSLFR
jgi:hypothetical protein